MVNLLYYKINFLTPPPDREGEGPGPADAVRKATAVDGSDS